ncbi:coronin, actin binding protein [Aureococcus anophagefferens]|uniref:Coronin, actin binding protein n=1 Tax=Aureococcus anophagefferens TaxID=44056 RepID=A0ABR1G0X5_AURAN
MVHKVDLDQAAGVIVPYYDCDTKVLYLCGKGDGNIRYYEMSKDKPFARRFRRAFQDDIFPDTFSGHPSCTADEWLSGVTKTPLMMSLNPDSAGRRRRAARPRPSCP